MQEIGDFHQLQVCVFRRNRLKKRKLISIYLTFETERQFPESSFSFHVYLDTLYFFNSSFLMAYLTFDLYDSLTERERNYRRMKCSSSGPDAPPILIRFHLSVSRWTVLVEILSLQVVSSKLVRLGST